MKRDGLISMVIGVLAAYALGFTGLSMVAVAGALSFPLFVFMVGTDPAIREEDGE